MHNSGNNPLCPPIAIGGVGGSGTRLIANMLKKAGYYIGSDLNDSEDNLWFTLLFRYSDMLHESPSEIKSRYYILEQALNGSSDFSQDQIKLINKISSRNDALLPADWLRQRATSLLTQQKNIQQHCWGWKEPNTHLFIDHFLTKNKSLKYIHVVRNGLDMSFSHNQNQLRIWGKEVLNDDIAITPYYSLKYWCEVQRRMTCLSERFGNRVLLVNFDRLCQHNDDELARLMSFIGQEESKHEKFSRLIKTPGSIGRYKNEDLGQFDPKDIDYFNNTFFNV
ncbi:MAG: sulfotransferase [Gammaproteobacteria bacterium]|nr:sulfotransferase [Gammaproteobacteria bacterium]